MTLQMAHEFSEGIFPVCKPENKTSFSIVSALRKHTNIKKIGHVGTLDPFASGVLVMLIGRNYTRLAPTFINDDKEYIATFRLGMETDSYDRDGQITATSSKIPSPKEVEQAIALFQGKINQIPPMFSAKKVNGKKLYHLARKGLEIERKAVQVEVKLEILKYAYPSLELHITCSKGTYIRSLAHDIGKQLETGGYVETLVRIRSGIYTLDQCINGADLFKNLQC
ncbi:MAG: tRNA pseudouridine(55) synthase TruB [Chlamydiae bacterium]|nr:tRNA pseudouridine(55) synthase TruB [Chlamydiota bacterium]